MNRKEKIHFEQYILKTGMRIFTPIMITLCLYSCISFSKTYESIRGHHLFIESGEKKLFWFSQIHSNDPQSIMFNDIEKELLEFKPSYVLVEGGFNKSTYKSKTEAILAGESAYTAFLSKQIGIPCGSIEPTNQDITRYLQTKYSDESILTMYIFRQMYQKQREAKNTTIDFESYFFDFARSAIRDGLQFKITDFILISQIIDKKVGYHVDQSNWLRVDTYNIVYSGSGLIHEIWQETIDLRNIHVLEILKELFLSNDRIFIMMGFDHAVELSDRLHQLMKEIPTR